MVQQQRWRFGLALFALTLAVHVPALTSGFLSFDDDVYVTDNPMVQRGLSTEGWWWAWTTFHASNWHPLTWLSHMLDVQVFGSDPRGPHLVNVLLHVANTLVLFALMCRLLDDIPRSALVAALFALHPLHVESVAWVSERKDVLSGLFGLLALWSYAGYAQSPGVGRYLLVLVFFALGLLAKPMLVTLPCVMLLLDAWPLRRDRSPGWLVWEKLPLLALSLASCALTLMAQAPHAMVSAERLPWNLRCANAVVSYARYLGKTIWPGDLAAYYPLHRGEPSTLAIVLATLLMLGVTLLAVRLRNRLPSLLVGWLWFCGMLVPAIGIVQVGAQAMADRYTYLPLIGIFLAVVGAIPDRYLLGLVPPIAMWAVLTVLQIGTWRDDGTLWRQALRVDERNAPAHLSLGAYLYPRGEVDEAEAHFRRALELSPGYAQALGNLGISALRQGQIDEAGRYFEQAIHHAPRVALHWNGLGLTRLRRGDLSGAEADFREALRLAPEMAECWFNLGIVLEDRGSTEARSCFEEGLRIDPRWPRRSHSLARFLLDTRWPKLRCVPEAILRARQACRLEPADPQCRATLVEARQAGLSGSPAD